MAQACEVAIFKRDPDHLARPHGFAAVQAEGTPGDDTLHGDRGPDTISGLGGDDVLNGRLGNDALDGGKGNDLLKGAQGDDKLYGGSGDDVLYGGSETQERGNGGDTLDGGSGDDRIYGGYAGDSLSGGLGKDRFMYAGLSDSALTDPDEITDFESGKDKLVFRGAFREAGSLHFIGDAAFSHTAGEVRFEDFSSPVQAVVEVDLDGDGGADFRIVFTSEIHFQASDFSF